MISFVVAGNPVPWERTQGNGKRRFTPERTRAHEALIAGAARIAGARPLDGPVRLEARFFRDSARRCDIDNLVKSVQDALNRVAYADDSQIVEVVATKAIDREQPRTEVTVRELVVVKPLSAAIKAKLARGEGTFPGDFERTETGHTRHCDARKKWGDGECECGLEAETRQRKDLLSIVSPKRRAKVLEKRALPSVRSFR